MTARKSGNSPSVRELVSQGEDSTEDKYTNIINLLSEERTLSSLPATQGTLYNLLAYIANLAKGRFMETLEWLQASISHAASNYDKLFFVGTIGSSLVGIYKWSTEQFLNSSPNIVATTVSLMFGTAYSYVFGSWVGGIFWVNSTWLNAFHSLFTLGTGISIIGTALMPFGGLLVGRYVAPTIADFMAEFGLGPYSTPEKSQIAAKSTQDASLIKKIAGSVMGAVLLGVFVGGQLNLSWPGAQAMYFLYRTLFSWMNGGPLSLTFILAMPEFCLLITNLKRGNLKDAVKAISTKIILGNLLGFLRGEPLATTNQVVAEAATVAQSAGQTASQLRDAIGVDATKEAVGKVVEKTWGDVLKSLRLPTPTGLDGIMGIFKKSFTGMVRSLGSSALGICCAAILAAVAVFRYYRVPKGAQVPENQDHVVKSIEGLVTFQGLLVKHLDDMMSERVPAITNSQPLLHRLRQLGPPVSKHFDDDILVRLTAKDGVKRLGEKYFECASELRELALNLDLGDVAKSELLDTLQDSATILLSKVTLIESSARAMGG